MQENRRSTEESAASENLELRRESQAKSELSDKESHYILRLASTEDENESYYVFEEEEDVGTSIEYQLLNIFERYQRARILFAQRVIDVAANQETSPDTIATFQALGVIALLCPLLFDVVPSIQGLSLVALAKLAACSQIIAEELVKNNILHLLVTRLKQETTENTEPVENTQPCSQHFKKSALFLLKSISKHNEELALSILEAEIMPVFMACLKDAEISIQESAVVTMESIVKHSADLANTVVSENEELVEQLLSSLPNLPSEGSKATLSMFYEFCQFPDKAKLLMKNDLIPILSEVLEKQDEDVKRLVVPIFSKLSSAKKKTAEKIANTTKSIEYAIVSMSDEDPSNATKAAEYINECFKYASQIRQRIIDAGVIPAITAYIQRDEVDLVPAMKCLSVLSSTDKDIGNLIIEHKGLEPLRKILDDENTDEVKELTILTIGTIGTYGPECAEAIAEAGVLDAIARLLMDPETSSAIQTKCTQNLKKILKLHVHLPVLKTLMEDSAPETVGMALFYYNKILRSDKQARKMFITSGWLKKVYELEPDPDSPLERLVDNVKTCFPPIANKLNNPAFLNKVLVKVERFRIPSSVQPIDIKEASRDSSQWSVAVNPSNTKELLAGKRKEPEVEEEYVDEEGEGEADEEVEEEEEEESDDFA